MPEATLFDASRATLGESIDRTAESLAAHGAGFDHWAVAYSGGKDSTTVLTLVRHLIRTGRVRAPRRFTTLYADTRMELPPLAAAAGRIMGQLRREGVDARTVTAPLDRRFLVYMLGRGVPPPNNTTFRWCTRQIKIDPMQAELARLVGESREPVLMLTGVRVGESAVRDAKIAVSCGINGGECGQGWFQEKLPSSLCATLAPVLHWRTCLVWDWLNLPDHFGHGYPTRMVAEAYGLEEDGSEAEVGTRTGCNGCPLASVDTALENLLRSPRWSYLEPLRGMRPVFRRLREPANRLRKPGSETSKAGVVRYTNRMGPITLEARRAALADILAIQDRCNAARPGGMPAVDMLDAAEVARVEELIAAATWPDRWDGSEPTADLPFLRYHPDGSCQLDLFHREGEVARA